MFDNIINHNYTNHMNTKAACVQTYNDRKYFGFS